MPAHSPRARLPGLIVAFLPLFQNAGNRLLQLKEKRKTLQFRDWKVLQVEAGVNVELLVLDAKPESYLSELAAWCLSELTI